MATLPSEPRLWASMCDHFTRRRRWPLFCESRLYYTLIGALHEVSS